MCGSSGKVSPLLFFFCVTPDYKIYPNFLQHYTRQNFVPGFCVHLGMDTNGDIILIEDDADDREILIEAFDHVLTENNYDNRLVVIEDSAVVINYLRTTRTRPFLMLSDINMPKIDGFSLRSRIMADPVLNARCIPYLFLTTSDNADYIDQAYKMSVQGYFCKPVTFSGYKTLIAEILSYWKQSHRPCVI